MLPVQRVLSVNSVSKLKTSTFHLNVLCKLTIGIPRLPCLLHVAKVVSSTVALVNCVTFDTVNFFNFAMCAIPSRCLRIELVSCSDGCGRTWSQTVHMIPGLPVSSMLQCKLKSHASKCLELFRAIGCFEHRFIQAHQVVKMICNVSSLISQITTHSFLVDIIISCNTDFKDFVSDNQVGNWTLGNSTWVTGKRYIIVKLKAGSSILTLKLEGRKNSDLWDIACIFVRLDTRTYNDEAVATSSGAVLPIKAADCSIMRQHHCVAVWLSKMQAQISLTLRWWSFLGDSSDIVTSILSNKGGQYYDYGCMLWHSTWIIQDAKPKIGDAPLTLIVRMP